MIVAVTGATGFIGRHLTTSLVERGVDVRAIVRPGSPRTAAPGATIVSAPLEPSALERAFEDVDCVVHLAGIVSAVSPETFVGANVEGTRAVAAAARRRSAHLVHISSLAAAGPSPASHPRTESDTPAPITPYGRSKLEGERVVQSIDGLRWTILRPGVVYGPGDRAMLPLFQFANRGVMPLVGRRDAAYVFMHVADTVRAIEAAIETRRQGDVMFIGHPRPVTALEVLQTIRAAMGRRAVILPIPGGVLKVAAVLGELAGRGLARPLPLNRSRYEELVAEGFVCRVDAVRDRLGIVASTDIREGFEDLARWYRRAGWL
jgi:nucleoside-diphosphate-sugar epimerase